MPINVGKGNDLATGAIKSGWWRSLFSFWQKALQKILGKELCRMPGTQDILGSTGGNHNERVCFNLISSQVRSPDDRGLREARIRTGYFSFNACDVLTIFRRFRVNNFPMVEYIPSIHMNVMQSMLVLAFSWGKHTKSNY